MSYWYRVSLLIACAAPAQAAFEIEVVDGGVKVGSSSIAKNGADELGVAFGNDGLRYARFTAGAWTTELARDVCTASTNAVSLAFDALDQPAIAYVDQSSDLWIARYDGAVWSHEFLDDPANTPSLAFDDTGNPWISYQMSSRLRVARFDGTAWILDNVDSGGRVGQHSSIAFGPTGNATVSYYDSTNQDLKLARHDGTGWTTERVDTGGLDTSLSYDPDGGEAISHYDQTDRDLKLARWIGGAWSLETVDSDGTVGSASALTFLGDHPVISYRDQTNLRVKVAQFDGTVWAFDTIDIEHSRGPISLVHDAADEPAIAFVSGSYDTGTFSLEVARRGGGTWTLDTLTTQLSTAREVALGLTAAGTPNVAYVMEFPVELRHGERVGGVWETEAIAVGASNRDISLAVDGADCPGIAYVNTDDLSGTRELRFAWHDGAAWATEVVVSSPSSLLHTSLQFDGADEPLLAYHDASAGALTLARREAGVWSFETIDPEGGRRAELAFDKLGNPAVCYHLSSADELRYAVWTGGAFVVEAVDSGGSGYGDYCSLAFDADGHPWISFRSTGSSLALAENDGAAWTVTRFSTEQGWDTAMAMDPLSDLPRVFYSEWGKGLVFMSHDGSDWISEVVDPRPSSGLMVALELDAAGDPHAAYEVSCAGDVRYARGGAACAVIPPVRGMVATKAPAASDITLEWPPSAEPIDGYNVWRTNRKVDLPEARAGSPPPSVAAVCTGIAAAACVDPAAPAPGETFFYQSYSVCGGSESEP